MSAALKRRFNIIVLPTPGDINTEIEIVRKRITELATNLDLKAALPSEEAVEKLIENLNVKDIPLGMLSQYFPMQYQRVVDLALQAQFPQTQQFAQQLLIQRQINTVTYLKLIYAKHFESSKIRQQPSLQMDDLGQVQQ